MTQAHARPGAGREVAEQDLVLRVQGHDQQHGQGGGDQCAPPVPPSQSQQRGRGQEVGKVVQAARAAHDGQDAQEEEPVAHVAGPEGALESERCQHQQRRHRQRIEEPVLVGDEGRRGRKPGGEGEGQGGAHAEPPHDEENGEVRDEARGQERRHEDGVFVAGGEGRPEVEVEEGRLTVEIPEALAQLPPQEERVEVLPIHAERPVVEAETGPGVERARDDERGRDQGEPATVAGPTAIRRRLRLVQCPRAG